MRDLSCLVLEERDFPVLAAACGGDASFPKRWHEWQELIALARSQAGADSGPAVALDPHDFIAWCNQLDVLPCLAALRAYAILQRPENRARRYGKKLLCSGFGPL
ncbi:MAG: hypothetical protein AB1430_16805 [Pseudomonadota bacterium]